jgi:hypothetical protein
MIRGKTISVREMQFEVRPAIRFLYLRLRTKEDISDEHAIAGGPGSYVPGR